MARGSVSYLGTTMTPDDYYHFLASTYFNPHQDAVAKLLEAYKERIPGRLLDIGCGAGLASRILGRGVGVDRSPDMTYRYKQDTGFEARVANFWDALPKAESAMAVYSLHLCPPSRIHQFEYRLQEAGVKNLLVISPLKRAGKLSFRLLDSKVEKTNLGKTIYGWVYKI